MTGRGAHVDVFILTGQSNSLGTTADRRESDVTPGDDPVDEHTRFFWSNASSQNNAYPLDRLYGDSRGIVTTLQAQQGDGGANSLFWGPEIGFARTLAQYGQREVLIVKASRGGGGSSLWSKEAFLQNPSAGHMYQHVVDTVRSATTVLEEAGDTFEIKGLLYLQGESDTGAEAHVAGERLAELTASLRAELPHAENLHTVVGGIAAPGETRDIVRARQSALALSEPTIDYFTNLDLVDSLYDGLHFDKGAKLEIGSRFARRVLQQEGKLPAIDVVGFADVALDPGATRLVFEDYVPDPDGSPNGNNLSVLGTFRGFVEGSRGAVPAGVIVDSADPQVRFGDRSNTGGSSNLLIGDVPLPAAPPRALGGTGGPNGRAIRFTFVDPVDAERSAAVSSVAFELGFVEPTDQITATFLDLEGHVLERTGVLGNGPFGFASFDRRGGLPLSNIHQVVISGKQGAAWIVGRPEKGPAVDFAYGGFHIVPEPSTCCLLLALWALFPKSSKSILSRRVRLDA